MKLIVNNEEFECVVAVKGKDYIKLYTDETMTDCIVEFGGIVSFDSFVLEGGEWTDPPLTEIEQLRLELNTCMSSLTSAFEISEV